MSTLIGRAMLVGMSVGISAALILGPAAGALLAAPKLQPGADLALAEAVTRGVAATSHLVHPSASPGIAGELGALTEGLRPPVSEETPVPVEEPTPEPQEEASSAPSDAPVINLAERVEYTSGGITLQAPAAWEVYEGDDGSLFDMSISGTDFAGVIQDAGGDFPGLLMVIFFANLPDVLIGEYLDDATISGAELSETAQGFPMVTVLFEATAEGVAGSGAIYVVSPGETVYLFIAFAPTEEWEMIAPGASLVAESITFDADLQTLATGESGGLAYSDSQGYLELVLPEGWHAASTDDETLPVIVTDPEYRFAVALGMDPSFDAEMSAEVGDLLDFTSGEIDVETQALIFELLYEVMNQDSGFAINESLNAVYPREGAATFRVAGEGDMGGGLSVPVAVYLDLRAEGGLIGMVFGDTDHALTVEADLLAMLASAVLLQ